MKLFNNAIIKLTILYTVVLMALSIGFSAAFYTVTDRELGRPIGPSSGIVQNIHIPDDGDFHVIIHQRDNNIRSRLLFGLIFINTAVLMVGAVVSYFLARLTLKPINDAMNIQAQFVQDASHELRTPLAAIAMENEVLLRDKSAGKKELLAQVESNLEEVAKLQELTDRLLKLSQDEPVALTQVPVRLVAEKAVSFVQKTAITKHIRLVVGAPAGVTVAANAELLTELLVILLDNAIKYSPAKTTVTLGYENGALFVNDEGLGIAAADLPHIFDRFYRAEKSRTSSGYGLGLPLAQRLAEQMGLKITVQSSSQKGATFCVTDLKR